MQPINKKYRAETVLFQERDKSQELFIISSGTVQIYKRFGSRDVELCRLEKGAVFGEMALIDGKQRSASARCITDCTIIIIPAELFRSKISGVPDWFLSVVKIVSMKIRKGNERLQHYYASDGSNVVRALDYVFKRHGNKIKIIDTKHLLIRLLSSTDQRVSAVLRMLTENKLLSTQNEFIEKNSPQFDHFIVFLKNRGRKEIRELYSFSPDQMKAAEFLFSQKLSDAAANFSNTPVAIDELKEVIPDQENIGEILFAWQVQDMVEYSKSKPVFTVRAALYHCWLGNTFRDLQLER